MAQPRSGSTPGFAWWRAGWSVVCGALATGHLTFTGDILFRLLMVIFVAGPLLAVIWSRSEHVALGLRVWRSWAEPLAAEDRISRLSILAFILGVLVAAGLSLWLGKGVPDLFVPALGLGLGVLVIFGPTSNLWGMVRSALEVGLGWIIGYVAFAPAVLQLPPGLGLEWGALMLLLDSIRLTGQHLTPWWAVHGPALTIGLSLTGAHVAAARVQQTSAGKACTVFNLACGMVVAVLFAIERPFFAGLVALLLIGQLAFQPWISTRGGAWYLSRTQGLFLVSMLLAALAVGGWTWLPSP